MVEDALLRIAAAVLLGGVLGYEREHRGRPAGLRTHILVCLASTVAMIASEHLQLLADGKLGDVIRIDPGRMAAGIVTGIGFIGAGTIIHVRSVTHGLTTAASIWFVAVLGIAIGAGLYSIAAIATATAFGVLYLLHYLELLFPRDQYYQLTLHVSSDFARTSKLEDFLRGRGFVVNITRLTYIVPGDEVELALDLRHHKPIPLGPLIDELHHLVGKPTRIVLRH